MGVSVFTKKSLSRIIVSSFIGSMVLFSFQNCGSQFKIENGNVDLASLSALAVPVITFDVAALDLVNTNQYTLNFEIPNLAAAQIKTVTCQLNQNPAVDCSNRTVTFSQLTDGDYQLKVVVENSSGIKGESTKVFRKDSTAPTIIVGNKPLQITNQTAAMITFTGNDNLSGYDRAECSLDNAAFAACVSPINLAGLAQGAHSFKIRSYDKATNLSLPTDITWNVDLVVPVVTFSQTPLALTNQTTANFAFASATAVSFECKLDNGGFAACTSPKNLTGLLAGNHSFQVRGISAAGNVSLPVNFNWTVDLAIPVLTFAQTPSAVTNQTTANFTFSGAGVVSYECQLDAAAYAACVSPKVITGLTAGAHVFRVRGTSGAGNVSVPIAFNWSIDLTAPTVTISQMPLALTNQTTATFAFSGAGVVTYECQLDGGEFAACVSPKVLTALTAGTHTFNVRGTSAVGNVSAPAAYTWTVELAAPVITLTQTPAAVTNSSTANFAFSSSNVANYECSLDGAAFAACVSPKTYVNLAATAHLFKVRGTSLAGNLSAEVPFNWTIDLTPPTVTLTATPPNLTNVRSANITFTGTNVVRFECSTDNGAFFTCTSPVNILNAIDGAHTFAVRAYNAAGSVSTLAQTTWTVDTVLPSTPNLVSNVSALTNLTSITLSFSSTDASGIARFECSANGAAFAACVSPYNLSSRPEGANNIAVRAIDNASNISASGVFSWTVDSIPPVVPTLTKNVGAVTNSTTATLTFTSTDSGTGVASYQCVLDGVPTIPCTSPRNLSGLPQGTHVFSAVAVDVAGNQSPAAAVSWTVDLTPPSLAFTQTPALTTAASDSTFAFTASDASGITGFQCSIDGSGFAICTSPFPTGPLGIGAHTLRVTVSDTAGNSNLISHTWTIQSSNIKQMASGEAHTCIVTAQDTVQCWGDNSKGQLGNSTVTWSKAPMDVVGVSGVKQITAGSYHTCVTTNSGSVVCWGNSYFAEGISSYRASANPLVQTSLSLSNVKQISAGKSHTCVLTSGDTVKCWGVGSNGELGNNAKPATSAQPVDVVGLSGIKYISAGNGHTCAVTAGDTLKCWGYGLGTYQGGGQYASSAVPVDLVGTAGTKQVLSSRMGPIFGSTQPTDCLITTANEVKCWGVHATDSTRSDFGAVVNSATFTINTVAPLAGTLQLTAGAGHFCGITPSETVRCFGNNMSGQLGNNSLTYSAAAVDVLNVSGAKILASGDNSNCIINAANTIKCWGSNSKGQNGLLAAVDMPVPVDAPGFGSVLQVSTENEYTCALNSGGTVKCLGNNKDGLLGNNTKINSNSPVDVIGVSGAVQIGTGQFYACALTSGGAVKCWGPLANSLVAIDMGLSGIKQISVGDFSACALTNAGTIKCWGDNTSGTLGNGSTVRSTTPVDVVGISGAKQVMVGNNSACAVTASDTVKCWGSNTSGQLGNNTLTSSLVPVDVVNLTGVKQIAVGSTLHSCALLFSGNVKCWGYAYGGALGVSVVQSSSVPLDVTSVSGVKQIDVGGSHTCIVTASDTVQCWGDGYFYGELGNNTYFTQGITPVNTIGLSGIKQVDVGGQHSCAVTAAGNVKCWGMNNKGQLGNNPVGYTLTAMDAFN